MTDVDLMSQLADETLMPLAAAAKRLGQVEGRGPLAPSTLARWATRGVRTPTGGRVRLEHVRVGSRLATSWPAVCRFLAASTRTPDPDPTPTFRSPAERRKGDGAAAAELSRLGL